jgi:hypothetical protein
MKNKDHIDFKNDLLSLYAKVKHSEIESLFIKIANAEITDLHKWLLKNSSIKHLLNNPELYDTLIFLNQLRGKYAYGTIENKDILPLLLFNRPLIPILMGMSKLTNDVMARDILLPFKDILDIVGNVYKPGEGSVVSTESIFNDITKIKNSFIGSETEDKKESQRKSIQDKRFDMYKALLYKFNDIVSSSAESSGLPDVAEAIKKGALTKIAAISLSNFFRFSGEQSGLLETSKKLADFVFKNYNPRMVDYNYSIIEGTLLSKSRQIKPEDLQMLKIKHEKEKNIMDYLEDGEKKYDSLDINSLITPNKHMNPDYLLMLSVMFVFIQKKLGLPSL